MNMDFSKVPEEVWRNNLFSAIIYVKNVNGHTIWQKPSIFGIMKTLTLVLFW